LGIGKFIHGGFVKGRGHGVVHLDLCILIKVNVLTEALIKVIINRIGFAGGAAVKNDAGQSSFKAVVIYGCTDGRDKNHGHNGNDNGDLVIFPYVPEPVFHTHIFQLVPFLPHGVF